MVKAGIKQADDSKQLSFSVSIKNRGRLVTAHGSELVAVGRRHWVIWPCGTESGDENVLAKALLKKKTPVGEKADEETNQQRSSGIQNNRPPVSDNQFLRQLSHRLRRFLTRVPLGGRICPLVF